VHYKKVPLKPFPRTRDGFANLGTAFHPPIELAHFFLTEDIESFSMTCKDHTMSFHCLQRAWG